MTEQVSQTLQVSGFVPHQNSLHFGILLSKYISYSYTLNLPVKLKNIELYEWILSEHKLAEFPVVIFILKDCKNDFKIRILYASTSHHLISVIENSNDMV